MFSGVGQTNFSKPETPQIMEYGVFKDDPICPKVFYQPGGDRNVQYVLSPQPLGPDKAVGLKITPTDPSNQTVTGDGSRGLLESLVDIEPLTQTEVTMVKDELRAKFPDNAPLKSVLDTIPLKAGAQAPPKGPSAKG